MVMFMNEWEVREAQDWFDPDEQPNLRRCAVGLLNLMEWTNSNSDGWAYWQVPIRSAGKLMERLQEARGEQRHSRANQDMSSSQMGAVFRPVRDMLRKQGVENTDEVLFPKPPARPKESEWSHADQASSVLQVYAMEARDGRLGDEGSDEFVEVVVSFLTDLKHLLYRAGPSIMMTDLVDKAIDRWDVQCARLPKGGPDEG